MNIVRRLGRINGKVAKPFSLLLSGLVFLGCAKSVEISAIEEAIRLELEKPKGELTQEPYLGLKKLSVYRTGRPVTDISLLNEMPNLEELDFAGGDISDPAPLAKLTKLWHLQIAGCGLKDFSTLSGMASLEELMASSNRVSDLSSLQGLTKLRSVALDNNLIKDTSPLSGLKSLKWVNLTGNPISEKAIEDLKKALPGCKIEHD